LFPEEKEDLVFLEHPQILAGEPLDIGRIGFQMSDFLAEPDIIRFDSGDFLLEVGKLELEPVQMEKTLVSEDPVDDHDQTGQKEEIENPFVFG
jgi:hypothetical protein